MICISFPYQSKDWDPRIVAKGINWDEELSPESQEQWLSFFEEMKRLNDVVLERCSCPFIAVELPILRVFADASRGAFGTCAYIRSVDVSGLVAVKFVAAKYESLH
jgi:hypothetical protein